MPNLLIIRGAPGSGKSTIAKSLCNSFDWEESNIIALFDVYFEVDQWMINEDGQYEFDHKRLQECHDNCFKATKRALAKGWNVIVSNTNLEQWQFERYVKLANEKGYTLQFMIISSPDFKNEHGVSDEKVRKMEKKLMEDVVLHGTFGYR